MRRAHTEKRSQYNERKKENDKRGEEGATREEDRRTLFGRAETNVETSGGVSTICVYTRPSRPLDVYPSAGFSLSTSFPLTVRQSSYESSSSVFLYVFCRDSLRFVARSCRLRFIIPQLFRIHAIPFRSFSFYLSPFCYDPPSSLRRPPFPSLFRPRGTITRPSIKYTFVGGPAMWRPVIYFSSNCNFSNTYCPLDKCARLFLTC